MYKKLFACLCVAVIAGSVGPAESANAQTVSAVETTGNQSALLAKEPSTTFGSAAGGSYQITIDPTKRYQQMDGFGGSITDSSAYVIHNSLTSAQQTALMDSLFSSTKGIGLTMLRQPMGATDFSAQGNFSYDDVAAGQTDVSLTKFSIAKDLTYTIPVLKQAFAVNPNIKVEFLPWSPPAWMKQSQTMDGGNFDDTYMPSLAQYFVLAIQAYQKQGIPIYAIAAQNEPENSNSSYPTETFSATEEATFIANDLGPALAKANLTPKILGYEHNWSDTTYPETLLGNAAAAQYLAGTSWHCYAGTPSAQSTVEAAYPSYGIWFTECSGETNGSFSGDFTWGMENLIIGATRNFAKSVTEWNIALNQNSGPTNGGCNDCYGFVTIDTSASPATVTPTTTYYLFGQANGVIPGGYRVQTNSANPGTGGIENTAFQNPDGSMVLIVFNDNGAATTVDVNWKPNNTNFTYTIPGASAITFYWTPPPVAPSVALTASPNPVSVGQSATLTATVTGSSGTPGGTVYFLYGSTEIGSATLNSSGVATFSASTKTIPSGSYAVTASYGGSSTYAAATSSPITVVVNAAATSASVTASPNPVYPGQTVTLKATVSSAAGTPAGSVAFSALGDQLGSVPLNGSGVATLAASVGGVPVGSYAVTASYGGNTQFAASSAKVTVALDTASTSTTLSAAPTSVTPPGQVTLTATVQRTQGSGIPSGTVTFYYAARELGKAALNNGVATLAAGSGGIPAGSYAITAEYSGDSSDAGSTSTPVSVTVQ